MRTIAIALSALLLTISSFAGGQEAEPYFCTKEGCTLEYVRKYTDGKVKWYHTMEISDVWLSEGKGTIKYSSQMKNGKGNYIYEPAGMVAFADEGDVTVNTGESVAAVLQAKLGKKITVTWQGGKSTVPSAMAPGDTLPDVECSVSALGMTMKIRVTERKVLRRETLRTNAGVFECLVVQEKKSEIGMGRRRFTTADTWYCRGMGMIRHDTYNKKGELETSEVLDSYRVGSL